MSAPTDRPLRLGTRGSALALVQARWVAARLAEHGIATTLEIVRTEGDDRAVDTSWGEGAFVGAIEAALLRGAVDVAVHSAKDLPTERDERLIVAAFPAREDPRDALVARTRGMTLGALPPNARVGTDSPRRSAFLRARRPDLRLHPLHGNVDTRLRKLDEGQSDALVLAVAGLTRLGRADRIDEVIAPDVVAPPAGQGALALQVRADDDRVRRAVAVLDDPAARVAVEAEREFLRATGGGCRSPIGVLGVVESGRISLLGGAQVAGADAGSADAPRIAWVRGSAADTEHLELARALATWIAAERSGDANVDLRAAVGGAIGTGEG